jgi:hypothetical protein
MLVQDFQVQLIRPPVPVRGTAAGNGTGRFARYRTLAFFTHFGAPFRFKIDGVAKTHGMAKQKIRPARIGGFSGAKACIWHVEVLKKRRNAKGELFAPPSNISDFLGVMPKGEKQEVLTRGSSTGVLNRLQNSKHA